MTIEYKLRMCEMHGYGPVLRVDYANEYFELNGADADKNDDHRCEAMTQHVSSIVDVDDNTHTILQINAVCAIVLTHKQIEW